MRFVEVGAELAALQLSLDDSISIPSVVSEHEAFLPRVISQRRFSSHATGSAASQAEAPRATMLPSHR